MEIRTLENISIEKIVDAFAESFKDYYVKIPHDYDYWRERLRLARFNQNLSVGSFDGEQLVAFILNCIDDEQGLKTAYNTGTGVIEEYRNQKLVDKMYDFITPKLQENGVGTLKLEVITQNARAIKVYKRIGFEVIENRTLFSFGGNLDKVDENNVEIKEVSKTEFDNLENKETYYTWDFRKFVLENNENLKIFKVFKNNDYKGFFILNIANNSLFQLESVDEDWENIFVGIRKKTNEVRIVNVNENRKCLLDYLQKIGLKNLINQYEMEKVLD